MNKRIYIGIINEYGIQLGKDYHKSSFKVLFDKNEILNQCIYDAGILFTEKSNNIENYNIIITICESAPIRYKFEYPAGFIKYFDDIISSSDNDLYDKILKCIDCIYTKYDYMGNLLETYVSELNPTNGYLAFIVDTPLTEDLCTNGYHSKFNYHYNELIQEKVENYNYDELHETYLCTIYHEHEPYYNEDSGIDDKILFFDGDLNTIIKEIKNELLSDVWMMYKNDEENLSNEVLMQLLNDKFKKYTINLFKINGNECINILNVNNINDLKEN